MKFKIALAAMLLLTLAPAVRAVETGNPEFGFRYAKEVCAECHSVVVESDISPVPEATSFREIANTPGMTAQALHVWFRTPHPNMPNLVLDIQNEDDVIAYILSLKED